MSKPSPFWKCAGRLNARFLKGGSAVFFLIALAIAGYGPGPGLGLGLGSAKAQSLPSAELGRAIVTVSTVIPGDARTAQTLGVERDGTGVVIDSSGLILTIGYVMMEAQEVTITLPDGAREPGATVAYDHASGFGLVRLLRPEAGAGTIAPLRLGNSDTITKGDYALVLSALEEGAPSSNTQDGLERATVTPVRIRSRRDFAGYWEYLLEDAIFSSPPAPFFAGAAMVDEAGELVGIGSLTVPDTISPSIHSPGNMFVPINALKPILGDLLETGRRRDGISPWLGVIAEDRRGFITVLRASDGGPARRAGLRTGDIIAEVAGEAISDLPDFWRKIRAIGAAGVTVPLTTLRPRGGVQTLQVQSIDRHDWLRLNPGN